MAHYTVELGGKQFDVDADNPQAAALAAHQVASQSARTPQARAAADAQRRVASTPGAVRAVNNGFAFNAMGKLDALGAAAETGVHNAFSHLTGQPDAGYGMGDAYSAVRDAEANAQSGFAKAHPVANIALGTVGAVANPVNRVAGRYVAAGATLPQMAMRGAVTGGAIGAAYGAGGARPGQMVRDAIAGDLSGTVIGAALPPIGAKVSQVARPYVDRALNAVRREIPILGPGTASPAPTDLRAAAAVARAIQRDGGSPAAIAAAAKAAPERAPFELGGQNLRGVGEVAAQSPGAARRLIGAKLADRSPQDMRDRVVGRMEDVLGVDPETIAGDFAGMSANLRTAASPLYEQAYSVGPIDSPKLQVLMTRPSMQRAMSRAARIAAEEGRDPTELGFRTAQRADPTTIQRATMEKSPVGGLQETWRSETAPGSLHDVSVQVENPTAQTWDYVKRGLDDVMETYRDPTTRKLRLDEEGRATLKTLNDLRGELVSQNPDYGAALDAGGEPLRLEEAFRDAPKLMGNGVNERVFSQRWSAATDAQRNAMKGGWANDVFEQARGGRLNLKTMQTPAYQAKLQAMFGPDASGVLRRVIGESRDMQTVGQQVLGGSPTYGRQAAAKDLLAQSVDPLDHVASLLDTGFSPVRLSGKALKAAIGSLPRTDRSVLGDPAANESLGRALTDPDEMTRLLNMLELHRARNLAGAGAGGALAPSLAQLPNNSR